MEPLPLSLKEKLFTTTMLLYGIVTASCGRNEPIEPEPLPRSDYQQIRDRYAALSYESGWPSLNDCDAALWAGLAATGYPVDLSLAFDEGKPYRRPSHDCYQQGNSHSTTSNDQITGLLWGIWVTQDKQITCIHMPQANFAFCQKTHTHTHICQEKCLRFVLDAGKLEHPT